MNPHQNTYTPSETHVSVERERVEQSEIPIDREESKITLQKYLMRTNGSSVGAYPSFVGTNSLTVDSNAFPLGTYFFSVGASASSVGTYFSSVVPNAPSVGTNGRTVGDILTAKYLIINKLMLNP